MDFHSVHIAIYTGRDIYSKYPAFERNRIFERRQILEYSPLPFPLKKEGIPKEYPPRFLFIVVFLYELQQLIHGRECNRHVRIRRPVINCHFALRIHERATRETYVVRKAHSFIILFRRKQIAASSM